MTDVPIAGRCRACQSPIWRVAEQQKEANGVKAGKVYLLWPVPGTIYCAFYTPTGYSQPLGYCGPCAPEIGGPPPPGVTSGGLPVDLGGCVEHVKAEERYVARLMPEFETFLSAHLRDQFGYSDEDAKAIEAMWARDRMA